MSLNEAETRAEHIDPALAKAGWQVVPGSRVRREYPITAGRLLGKGKRGKALAADYLLEYKGARLAVIEAKALAHYYTEGVSQAKDYATRLGVRFAYATNGARMYAIDMETGKEGDIDAFPTPDELWQACFPQPDSWRDAFAAVPHKEKNGWQIRSYQAAAVSKTLEAVARGRKRLLLNLATGTGKTAIAFQIAWKLFQTRWTLQKDRKRQPRILFLADRNILASQAYNNFDSFMAFPKDALLRISPGKIKKKGHAPKNASVFFTIFQTFMTGPAVEDEDGGENTPTPYFGQYPPDFFDCVIIDECHRGGARDESAWRAILEHFSPALQIGLTATPKRDVNVDTYTYFGEPIYTYSLLQGINDGYLTPFKVRRIASNVDDYTHTPDNTVLEGQVEPGQHFREKDFNVAIEIRKREEYRVAQFLSETDPRHKTLVFCANQQHALLIRDIINGRKSSAEPDYCVRVTADEGARGEEMLRRFQEADKSIPTILTTSHKLSTGVDALSIRNIVLLRPVRNMIEFKQIIGRGTRLFDGKDYFTVFDFVGAHEHFQDKAWDGDPLPPEPGPDRPEPKPGQPLPTPLPPEGPEPKPKPEMIRIRLAEGKEREFQCIKTTSYMGPDGKPLSAQEFLASLYGTLPALFKDEDQLRALWSDPETRRKLLAGLAEKGFGLASLQTLQEAIDAEKSDLYDVLAYVAFSSPLALRSARARMARQRCRESCTDPQKEFLDFVLAQYEREGFTELAVDKLSLLLKNKYGGSMTDGVRQLGGNAEQIRALFTNMQQWLYEERP